MIGRRAALVLTASLALQGCVLMSERPLYDDTQAVPILGDVTTFADFERSADGWAPSDIPVTSLVPEGRHYRMTDPDQPPSDSAADDTIRVHFVPLDQDHWLAQVTFPDPYGDFDYYYTVATWDGTELFLTFIECDVLQDRPGIDQLVKFTKDTCTLVPPAPGQAPDFPPLLWQDLPPPVKRLVAMP